MTYKDIKNIDNNNYRNALGNNLQTFTSDGLCGGLNNSVSLYPKASCTETMDLTGLNANYIGFNGMCFDGKYIYLLSQFESDFSANRYLLRYDTTQSFATGNVAAVKLDDIGANYYGYTNLCFDGRYIYLSPNSNDSGAHGYFLRYDTTAAFSTGNFSVYNLTSINANYKGYKGMCFDGRYIYLVPDNNGSYHGNFLRYDTTAAFNASASYEAMDLSSINALYVGYIGMIYADKYLYLIPHENNTNYHGNVLRIRIKP